MPRRIICAGINAGIYAGIYAMLCAAVFTALGLCGCGKSAAAYERQLFAMDTFMLLRVYSASAEEASSALDEAEAEVARLDGLLSPAIEQSDVYALNHSGGRAVAVDEDTYALLERTLGFSSNVGACFDCTLYPVSRAWGFASGSAADGSGGSNRVPSAEELAALLPLVDDSRIALDANAHTALLPKGSELELGAAAKGYAGDKLRDMLKQRGVVSALLDLGSSTIVTIGNKPDGGAWRIALRDPMDSSAYAGAVSIGEGSVSTSGGYERYFTGEDGTVYWHILDPKTGAPARNGIVSVTVLTDEAFLGDSLSTALFVMGLDDAVSYWRTNGGFEFIIITEDGGLYATEGAAAVFTPLGAYEHAKVTVIAHED